MRMIHSRRWGPALQQCLDGEASARRTAIVVRHLADCSDCASEMDLFRRMHNALARMGGEGGFGPAVARLRSGAVHISS